MTAAEAAPKRHETADHQDRGQRPRAIGVADRPRDA